MTTGRGPGSLAHLLGMRPMALEEGNMNPYGIVHGGTIYTLVDYAMGTALTSRLAAGERCATLEIKINYLAATTGGRIRAEAVVVERTTRIAVLEARVHSDDGRLLSIATGTVYISSGPS